MNIYDDKANTPHCDLFKPFFLQEPHSFFVFSDMIFIYYEKCYSSCYKILLGRETTR